MNDGAQTGRMATEPARARVAAATGMGNRPQRASACDAPAHHDDQRILPGDDGTRAGLAFRADDVTEVR